MLCGPDGRRGPEDPRSDRPRRLRRIWQPPLRATLRFTLLDGQLPNHRHGVEDGLCSDAGPDRVGTSAARRVGRGSSGAACTRKYIVRLIQSSERRNQTEPEPRVYRWLSMESKSVCFVSRESPLMNFLERSESVGSKSSCVGTAPLVGFTRPQSRFLRHLYLNNERANERAQRMSESKQAAKSEEQRTPIARSIRAFAFHPSRRPPIRQQRPS